MPLGGSHNRGGLERRQRLSLNGSSGKITEPWAYPAAGAGMEVRRFADATGACLINLRVGLVQIVSGGWPGEPSYLVR